MKRVRFAADRVEDVAKTPEATSASEDATTNSLPAHSSEAALPASAVEVPDHVMSEGAKSAPDAAVRLSMKRSSDSSHSESETERLHTDHSTRDVVVLLDNHRTYRADVSLTQHAWLKNALWCPLEQFVIPASCLPCCRTCHRTLLHDLSHQPIVFRPSSPSLTCLISAHSGLEYETFRDGGVADTRNLHLPH